MSTPAAGVTGRVAVVTGASRGIGKATALALANAGFDVAITARTVHEGEGVDDSDRGSGTVPGSLDTTAAAVEATGRRALSVPMDLMDVSTLGAAVDTVLSKWGRIDVLVNNAVHTGPGSMTRFDETSVEMIETKLAANAVAPVVLIKAVLPHMVERGSGKIVNVTSAVAINDPEMPAGEGGWGAAYAMSKGAMHRLAGILAVEYRGDGIEVFNLEPGYVVTERMEVNQKALGLEGVYPGAPPSVPASVIAWIASSPESAELNGQTIIAQRFAKQRGLHDDWKRR